MQSVFLSPRSWPGKLLSLMLALVLALSLFPRQALAVDSEEDFGYTYEITLPFKILLAADTWKGAHGVALPVSGFTVQCGK